VTLIFVGQDGYQAQVPWQEVRECSDCIVAFQDKGGFRVVMPGFPGRVQVRDLVEIVVDSGFLGVSSRAAFGASLAIVALGGRSLMIQGCAAVFAFAGLAASYFLARRIRFGDWVLRLVLAGIAVSALCASGTGVLKYLADPLRQLPVMRQDWQV
jgi:hypothetical protein